jgi:hypothetical protein
MLTSKFHQILPSQDENKNPISDRIQVRSCSSPLSSSESITLRVSSLHLLHFLKFYLEFNLLLAEEKAALPGKIHRRKILFLPALM